MASVTFNQHGNSLQVLHCGMPIGSIVRNDDLYRFKNNEGRKGCPYDSLEDLKEDLIEELS